MDHHESKGALATIALKAVDNPLEFGIVITREDGSIERFLEKPTWGQVFSDTINTGIYVLEPEIFDFIPEGRAGGLLRGGLPGRPRGRASPSSATWPRATGRTSAPSTAYLPRPPGHPRREGRRPGQRVPPAARACGWARGPRSTPRPRSRGPAIIGDNCHIGAGGVLGAYCVIGANVRIGDNASLERTVVHDNAFLGAGVRLDGCVLGRSCDLRQGVRCEEGVVLGDESFVGAHAVIKSGVKVYPFKTVEAGATVNTSIVWESRGARSLFGRLGHHRPRQRRHQPRAGHAPVDGVGQHAGEGEHHHGLARHVAGPPACSSGP